MSTSSTLTTSRTTSSTLSTSNRVASTTTSSSAISGVAAGSSGSFVAITTFSPGVSTIGASSASSASNANPTFVFLNASSTSTTKSDGFSDFARPTAGAAGAGLTLNNGKAPFILAQTIGGVPSKTPDLGASALGLVLFFIAMLICLVFFRKSRGRSQPFPMFIALAAFCFWRFLTMALRMGWANNQNNASLAITCSIFVAAGTIILYVINGILTTRIIKDQHRRLGEKVRFLVVTRILLFSIFLTLILMIVAVVQSAYSLNPRTRRVDRQLQLYGVTFFAIIAGLPLLVLLISHFTGHRLPALSKVGPSRHRRRVSTVVLVSLLLSFRAIWMCGAIWQTPTPLSQPLEWYFNKPAFYLVSLLPELLVVLIFCFMRIDQYFRLGIDGRFDDPHSTISSPEPLVTPLPAPRNPSAEPKIAWTPPPVGSDLEQGLRNFSNFMGARQRYTGGVNTMSPVDEERYGSSSKNISSKTSRESLSGQSYQYASTVAGDDNMEIPMPPKFSKRATQGTLSIISSFPDIGANGKPAGYGRGSLAMDPSTGLYHFVSAPLVPMFDPAAMGAAGDAAHSSMFFGESSFADPSNPFNSGGQSRASTAPTLLNSSFPFPSQSHISFQPLNFPTPPVPALTASNTGSSASSSGSSTDGHPDPNSAAGPMVATASNPSSSLPRSLQTRTPSPPQLPYVQRRPAPPNPLQSHPGPGAQQQQQYPPQAFRPGSIYQRRRSASADPNNRRSRMANAPQPPTLAALRLQDTHYSRQKHHSKSRALSSHMSMASTRSTGLDSLVNMVQSHANSSERMEQAQQQSQRERPGFPGRESTMQQPLKPLSNIPALPPLPLLPPGGTLAMPAPLKQQHTGASGVGNRPALRVSKSFDGMAAAADRPSTLSAGAREFWGQGK